MSPEPLNATRPCGTVQTFDAGCPLVRRMQEGFGRRHHSTMPRSPGNPKDQKVTGRRVIHPLPIVLQAACHGSRYAGLVVGVGVVGGIAWQLEAEYFGVYE